MGPLSVNRWIPRFNLLRLMFETILNTFQHPLGLLGAMFRVLVEAIVLGTQSLFSVTKLLDIL